MTAYNALSGISDMRFAAFLADGAEHIGPPTDPSESSEVDWCRSPKCPSSPPAGRSKTALH
jgi:hypothetical protein